MAVSSLGALAYGDRTTGDIYVRPPDGSTPVKPVAHVDVSTDGQRGLLSLAFDKADSLFASFTTPTGEMRVTIEQVLPGPTRVVWNGPPSATLANGAHIAFAPDGRLVTGIGDLLNASQTDNPEAPNGKMLSLDANGSPDQKPTVISTGWHNPFAFTFRNDGSLWVGDNEPGDDSERLARADVDGKPTQIGHVGSHKVASGLVGTADGSLWECTFLGQTLQRYELNGEGIPIAKGKAIAKDCSLGVVELKDESLAYSTGSQIRTVAP
jgi:hypothetical protein